VIAIIESIRRDRGNIYSANLPNQGQVPNLPEDVILESPARAARGGLHPLPLKPLSDGVLGTVIQKLACVETIVEAALEGSRRKFVQALVLDGALSSPEEAERLADELLRAQAQYLPQFSGDASVNA
jgi:alpha-galactosidase/6-phospho-beta-glucosidase family protein